MKLKLTLADVQAARPLPEGWYDAKMTTETHALSAGKDSVNFILTYEITDERFAGRQVNVLINNKNTEMFTKKLVLIVEATLGPIKEDLEEFEFSQLYEIPVKIHLLVDSWNGIPRNQIDGWLNPVGAGGAEIPLNI